MNNSKNEEVLKEILEQSLAGYWDWDIPTGKEYLSPSFKKMFGYEDHEIENHADSWQKLIFQEDLPGVYEKFNKHEESKGKIPFYNEVRYHHKNGSTVWVICTGKVIEWDKNGKAKRMVGCHIDITKRMEAEDSVRESEERFHSLFEKAPLGYQSLDSDGTFIEVNHAWLDTLGYKREEVIGKWFGDFLAPEYVQAFRERFPIFKAQGKIHSEFFMLHKDGSRRYIVFDGRIGHNTDGTFKQTHCILKDETERKTAESYREAGREILQYLNEPGDLKKAIHNVLSTLKTLTGADAVGLRLQEGNDFPYFVQEGFSKDFLLTENTLVERGEDGGVCRDKDGNVKLECTCGLVISGKTDPSNALFTKGGSCWTNDSFPLLDLPPNQDPRLHPRNNCIHQGYASVALIPLRLQDLQSRKTCFNNGFNSITQVPIRTTDEIVGLIQLNDKRKGRFTLETIEILEDIAAHIGSALMRKRAEEKLYAISNRQEAMLSAIPDIVIEVNQNKVYTWANQAGLEFYGADVIGKEASLYFEGEQDTYSNLSPLFNGNENVIYVESWQRRKDGEKRLLAWWCRVLKDAQGVVTGALSTARDITDSKKLEAEMQKAQKLESLGLLAGGIAHDFNNIMGGIFGYIDMANVSTKETKVNSYLSKAMNTIERARDLTQQLLTFAKGGDPHQEIGHLFPFIEETARFALSGANVSCNFDIPPDLWACNFDKNQIGQVIDNLIINAQQAMPVGGTINLTARNIALSENEHPSLKTGDYVKISIKDTGIGISNELITKIFDPFFTTKAKGHGLGLATCYSIINRHGGCIDVESEQGKGSTFKVYLPASPEAATANIVSADKTHKGSGTFLIMDDEEVMRDIIGDMLKSLGYTVISKENGKEAVEFLLTETKANRTITGLIFDLTVPGGMGGKAAIEEIRKTNTDIIAFVASGYADDPVIKNPKEYGFMASICKPFIKSELSEMLNQYMKLKEE